MSHQLEQYDAVGMDGHIAKPVSVQALELAIARLLSRRSGDADTDLDSKEAPEQ